MAELLLATDVDDFLFEHAGLFCEWSNAECGTNLQVHEYHEDWPLLWGLDITKPEDMAEATRRRNLFITPEIFREFPPIEGMPEAMQQLKGRRKFGAAGVTKRRTTLESVTWAAINQHYPNIYEHLVCLTEVNDQGVRVGSRDKVEVCIEMGAFALADDQWEAPIGMALAGLEGVVFNRYPMNFPDHLFPAVSVNGSVKNRMPLGLYEVRDPDQLLRHFNADYLRA